MTPGHMKRLREAIDTQLKLYEKETGSKVNLHHCDESRHRSDLAEAAERQSHRGVSGSLGVHPIW
jgi:hypothetical protein